MERWQQIESVFHEALTRDPGERDAYVREACRNDSDLRRQVVSLLENHHDGSESWAAAAAAQLIAGPAAVEPGQRLGPYEIVSPIGAGGMGKVYRARDTRLKRDVAIKVCAVQFSDRFEREARVIASLNHPNICHLHDVGPNFLVMELVEGENLSGPLPVETSLNYARQIAEALEAAHEKGVVHRDLKPANVKVTPSGVVKVLDFGLAKTTEESKAAGNPSDSPTVTMSATRAGMILGTAAYMSPEQTRGSTVDKRADIWAFGAVLYEMLSGKAAFQGETTSDVLASVLRAEPDWGALPSATPARIRTLLRRCLERDRKQRLRDIGEARIAIEGPAEDASEEGTAQQASPRPSPWLIAGVLAIAFCVAAVGWWRAVRSTPPPQPLIRLSADVGPDLSLEITQGAVAISPDGRRTVFVVRGADGVSRLATKLLDQNRLTLLAGSEDARTPFFSPKNDWIGFFADGKLKKISVQGGTPVALCDASNPVGASWGDDDNIIAGLVPGRAPLFRIPASGGTPAPIEEMDPRKAVSHAWPQVLPGSRAMLFNEYVVGESFDNARIEVLTFKSGERKTVERGYFPRYLRSGHLVFVRQNALFAALFDPGKLIVTAPPQPVLDDIAGSHFDFSDDGTFVYLSGAAGLKQAIFWLDSAGDLKPLHPEPGLYSHPRFSPDGKRLAFAKGNGNGFDIWVQDLNSGGESRRSFFPGSNWWPVWTPDGKEIAFLSGPVRDMYLVRADGASEPQRLTDGKVQGVPTSFSPGRLLAFNSTASLTSSSYPDAVWTAPLEGGAEHPHLGTAARFIEGESRSGQFSPDGRWIAYESSQNGTSEIFVQPFPRTGGKWQISRGGGRLPVWSRAAFGATGELFFLARDQHIMIVDYTATGNLFSQGTPRVWSQRRLGEVRVNTIYDLAPDGKRFAVILDAEERGASKPITSVTVLLNFFDYLRNRVPATTK